MARKKKKDDGGGGAYWMDTYGDMITLLMTFFVLLYSFSSLDSAKWEALVSNVSGMPMAVVAPLNPGRSIPPEEDDKEMAPMTAKQVDDAALDNLYKEQFDDLLSQIQTLIVSNNLESMLKAEPMGDQIMLRFLDSMLFDSGSADLRADSKVIMTKVLVLVEETSKAIKSVRIEGHTDNVPISNARYRDNWDLSCMRSTTVLRFLVENTDIDAEKFVSSGYGEIRPIASNQTVDGRAHNRRVDIVIERNVIISDYVPYPPIDPEEYSSPRTQSLWQ